MFSFGNSGSSEEGMTLTLAEANKLAAKARKVADLQAIAPPRYPNHFVTVTNYQVATTKGMQNRFIFQERKFNGRDAFTSKIISPHRAEELNKEYPGIVTNKPTKSYSRSLGIGKGRTSNIKDIDAYSRGRITAPRASIIPTKEFKAVASYHGVPPKTVTSIIRDMDALAYDEIKEVQDGVYEPYYEGDVRPYYAKGSKGQVKRSDKGKAYTESRKASHGSVKKHRESSIAVSRALFLGAQGTF